MVSRTWHMSHPAETFVVLGQLNEAGHEQVHAFSKLQVVHFVGRESDHERHWCFSFPVNFQMFATSASDAKLGIRRQCYCSGTCPFFANQHWNQVEVWVTQVEEYVDP